MTLERREPTGARSHAHCTVRSTPKGNRVAQNEPDLRRHLNRPVLSGGPDVPRVLRSPLGWMIDRSGLLHELVTVGWAAWSAVWVMMSSYSMGVKQPSAVWCRQRW
jgi:hypothetical protein